MAPYLTRGNSSAIGSPIARTWIVKSLDGIPEPEPFTGEEIMLIGALPIGRKSFISESKLPSIHEFGAEMFDIWR